MTKKNLSFDETILAQICLLATTFALLSYMMVAVLFRSHFSALIDKVQRGSELHPWFGFLYIGSLVIFAGFGSVVVPMSNYLRSMIILLAVWATVTGMQWLYQIPSAEITYMIGTIAELVSIALYFSLKNKAQS